MQHVDQAPEIYAMRYTAFVDILGFTEIVKQSAIDVDRARQIHAALGQVKTRFRKNPHATAIGETLEAQTFSDCVVISDTDVAHVLMAVTQLSLELMTRGMLVRGGIAKGLLYHAENTVFGPALIKAYGIEQTIAKFPRIVLDRATYEDYRQRSLQFAAFDQFTRPAVRLGVDGPPYVHLFQAFDSLIDFVPEQVRITGELCRATIQVKLNESIYDPRLYEKLSWLAHYWNSSRTGRIFVGLERIEFPLALHGET